MVKSKKEMSYLMDTPFRHRKTKYRQQHSHLLQNPKIDERFDLNHQNYTYHSEVV